MDASRLIYGCFVPALLLVATSACTPHVIKIQDAISRRDREYLLEQLTESEEEWIKEDAARGLGVMRDRGAVAPLLALLNNPKTSPEARASAGIALSKIGDRKAVRPVISAMERASHPEERYWLIYGLYNFCRGGHGSTEILSALKQCSSDSDVIIARAAKKGIYECTKGKRAKKSRPPSRPRPEEVKPVKAPELTRSKVTRSAPRKRPAAVQQKATPTAFVRPAAQPNPNRVPQIMDEE